MINLCVVQCSQLQYDSHMSAENATSSPKIPQLSIYYYHFHRQMIIHTSYSLELNLKPFFSDLHNFPFTFTLQSSHFWFCPVSLFFPLYLYNTLQLLNFCILKIQELGNLHNNYIKL